MSLCRFPRTSCHLVYPSGPRGPLSDVFTDSLAVYQMSHTFRTFGIGRILHGLMFCCSDGTTEDADANASIDRCQLLPECSRHLWLSFLNILTCHVSKDLLVLAKFYVIHTVNILTFHIFKNQQNTRIKHNRTVNKIHFISGAISFMFRQ